MNDMSSALKSQEFFSAEEMAELSKESRVQNFPHTGRRARAYAQREGWDQLGSDLCRKRPGRGGGVEYHYSLMPKALRMALEARSIRNMLKSRHKDAVEADQLQMQSIKATSLSARARAVMEARAEVLASIDGFAASKAEYRSFGIRKFLKAQIDYATCQEIEARRNAGEILTAQEAQKLARPPLLTAMDGFQLVPERLATANDRRSKPEIKRATLYNWFKALDERGVIALAPQPAHKPQPIPPGFAHFLKFYAIGSKPDAPDAWRAYMNTNPPPELQITLNQVRYILRHKLNNIEKNVGREGLLTLRSRLSYVTRTTEDMWPTTIYSADGKTFDAEIADPVTKRPIRPEITTVIDIVTRKVVGISLSRSETQKAVAEALRRSCVSHGICAIFYVDRGPGYRNQAMDADVSGLMGRLGITKMHAAPYGSQAKGRIERPNATIWDVLAKRLPTYIGKDMDKEAGDRIHKLTRRELKQFGQSAHLPDWETFVRLCDERVAEYNATPHRSLPKFQDPETGRQRHMSPNDAWDAHIASGFEPVPVETDEADDLFRPYEIRTVRRAQVQWNTNTYFHHDLEVHHETKVMVGYDYHQGDKVWVREFDVTTGQPGRLICVAEFMGNAERYVPLSYEQKALETRTNTRLKRNDVKRDAITAERDAEFLLDHAPMVPFADLDQPEREPVQQNHLEIAVDNSAGPKPARRRTFASDEELAAWALDHPDQLSRNQIDLLWECLNSSNARELFRMSGIDTEALRNLLRAVA
ncbi:Mu transposase C-terminal domain-containing protein [Pseudooceanicola spongiae]|uniref:DDE-type integrase/transposase/recombinase n=1 Tax=Pseudooceanicola spongiae TaxID=2613965 RepID=A0A7L9WM32_9RHOB|nr:Mu transposase C-terminal domain-containing protein [Pseudooceanicola spongiae]QOL80436.1 DDE-type integrase/transposase/recombinase [Pseudooceanicola spongiae]